MGRGSIDHLMEIGWIKPSGRKNIPGKPALWWQQIVYGARN